MKLCAGMGGPTRGRTALGRAGGDTGMETMMRNERRKNGTGIRPGAGSVVHETVRPVNVCDGASRTTNGELACPA
jgi:hypothetical protein